MNKNINQDKREEVVNTLSLSSMLLITTSIVSAVLVHRVGMIINLDLSSVYLYALPYVFVGLFLRFLKTKDIGNYQEDTKFYKNGFLIVAFSLIIMQTTGLMHYVREQINLQTQSTIERINYE